MNSLTIDQIIESYLDASFFKPSVQAILRRAIEVDETPTSGFGLPRHWGPLLPGWCCEAAGGQRQYTVIASAAWKLLHTAAQTLDNVADLDPPLDWWRNYGPGIAINTATALIISAESILLSQFDDNSTNPYGLEIMNEFHRSLEIISSGQHLDLLQTDPGINLWWDVAAAKSGEPFALACKIGAISAKVNKTRVEAFSNFGNYLGIILQIQDDVSDFVHEDLDRLKSHEPIQIFSLPLAYAIGVLPDQEKDHLQGLIESLEHDQDSIEKVVKIVENAGAFLYIESKIENLKEKASAELDLAADHNTAKESLLELLDFITKIERSK